MTDYPDAEALLVAYLAPIVAVPVSTRVPRARPARWVQVRRIGGPQDIVRDRPRLDVISWAGDDGATWDLCTTARSAIHALKGTTLLGGVACYQVEEFLGPTRRDDPDTGTPRMWMTVQLSLRTS
ncbi:hypothetical protein [Planobispora rosea]|uniref:hypothetical protein n=1 Tax=Planobispora rosea TaxID=35762 RepID=UPI00083A3D26|nr:hypothetical protein [Planobispora rosea]